MSTHQFLVTQTIFHACFGTNAQLLVEVEAVQPVLELAQAPQWPRPDLRDVAAVRAAALLQLHREGVDDLHCVHDADACYTLAVVATEEIGKSHQVLALQAHLPPRVLRQVHLSKSVNHCM